ncbi:uncharacterized protein EI90DRAFT_3058225, partial [Cantharellus anzutake]|uniref:uncharacterized protein n=1 Tax=Cantharellus anzutake TaxID=1750568 RepID=UPI0019041045
MATLLTSFFLTWKSVYAAPASPYSPLNATGSSFNISETCVDIRNCRTQFELVSSCLLTVFACVWTAVHPHLPSQTITLFWHL